MAILISFKACAAVIAVFSAYTWANATGNKYQ
jgi:hypothetical protein